MKFRLDESQVGIKTARRNTNDLRYADDTTLMAENEEDLKSLLMRMKKENEKADSKFSIQKTKIMTSNLISSCQKEREKSGGGDRFYFIGLSMDGDCTHETKMLAPWRESYDKPGQCIKKQRRHFANKGLHNQSYDFSNSHI